MSKKKKRKKNESFGHLRFDERSCVEKINRHVSCDFYQRYILIYITQINKYINKYIYMIIIKFHQYFKRQLQVHSDSLIIVFGGSYDSVG